MLSLVFLALISSVYGQVITPPRPVGFVYKDGNPNAKVHVDIYIDLTCPDCREAWPNVLEMANHYGPDNVRLTVHIFPLPYLQNGFYASRGTFVAHYLSNGTKTFEWIEKLLMDALDDLKDSTFHNKSDADLLQMFSVYAKELGLNDTQFLELVDRRQSNVFEFYARVMFKHACVLGVAGTPTYIVNGVTHPNILQSWTLPQWQSFINPLLDYQIFDGIDNVAGVSTVTTHTPCVQDNTCSGSTTLNFPSYLLIFTVASLVHHLWLGPSFT